MWGRNGCTLKKQLIELFLEGTTASLLAWLPNPSPISSIYRATRKIYFEVGVWYPGYVIVTAWQLLVSLVSSRNTCIAPERLGSYITAGYQASRLYHQYKQLSCCHNDAVVGKKHVFGKKMTYH